MFHDRDMAHESSYTTFWPFWDFSIDFFACFNFQGANMKQICFSAYWAESTNFRPISGKLPFLAYSFYPPSAVDSRWIRIRTEALTYIHQSFSPPTVEKCRARIRDETVKNCGYLSGKNLTHTEAEGAIDTGLKIHAHRRPFSSDGPRRSERLSVLLRVNGAHPQWATIAWEATPDRPPRK